jgi:hypothetical protein
MQGDHVQNLEIKHTVGTEIGYISKEKKVYIFSLKKLWIKYCISNANQNNNINTDITHDQP